MNNEEYYLETNSEWVRVTMEEFVRAERIAGFRNTMGRNDLPATGGFSGAGIRGRILYRKEELPFI